jgi:hypothetical protein
VPVIATFSLFQKAQKIAEATRFGFDSTQFTQKVPRRSF